MPDGLLWSIQKDYKRSKNYPSAGLPGGGDFFVERTMARVMRICYNLSVTASDTGDREEVNCMEFFASLIIAVAAGVICHLICKWLDGDK